MKGDKGMEYWIIIILLLIMSLSLPHLGINMDSTEATILGMTFVLFVIILVIINYYRTKNACGQCNKHRAVKLINTCVISKEDISILVELETKNMQSEVISTTEQYIPGTRTEYEDIYKCKYWVYIQKETRTVERKKV